MQWSFYIPGQGYSVKIRKYDNNNNSIYYSLLSLQHLREYLGKDTQSLFPI